MEFHLIRHPQPDIPPGICYGQTDLALVEPATVSATRLRPLLPASYSLHASPLRRARLLAEALGTPAIDERLKEISFGEWELQPFAAVGASLSDWAANPLGFCAPGGESITDLSARVLAWLDELRSNRPENPVVIVAHGGPLRVIAGHLLGIPPERWLGLDFAYAQSTRIDCESWGSVLKWFNR